MKKEWLPLSIFLIQCTITVAAFPHLPDTIATHFDANGKANGWMPRTSGALVMPVMSLFLYLVFTFLEWAAVKTDPDLQLDDFGRNIVLNIKSIMLGMMLLLQAAMFMYAFGHTGLINMAVGLSLGLIFIYIGWAVRFIKRNRLIGMRFHWSLADDENWRRTNTFGGNLFIALGVLILATMPWPAVMIWTTVGGAILGSIAIASYSWWLSGRKNQ